MKRTISMLVGATMAFAPMSAWAAETGPLSAGPAAGVKQAQDVAGVPLVVVIGGGIVIAGAVLAASGGSNGGTTTTTTTP